MSLFNKGECFFFYFFSICYLLSLLRLSLFKIILSRLALLVRVVFAIPAASSKSERVFSVAGRVVTPDRNRLAPEMVEDLVMLKCNLRLLRNLLSDWKTYFLCCLTLIQYSQYICLKLLEMCVFGLKKPIFFGEKWHLVSQMCHKFLIYKTFWWCRNICPEPCPRTFYQYFRGGAAL